VKFQSAPKRKKEKCFIFLGGGFSLPRFYFSLLFKVGETSDFIWVEIWKVSPSPLFHFARAKTNLDRTIERPDFHSALFFSPFLVFQTNQSFWFDRIFLIFIYFFWLFLTWIHLEICTTQFATGAGDSARTWCPSTAANCSNIWDGSSSQVSYTRLSPPPPVKSIATFELNSERVTHNSWRESNWMAAGGTGYDGIKRSEYNSRRSPHIHRIEWRPFPVWRPWRRPGPLRPDSFQAGLTRSIPMATNWRVPLGTTKTRRERYLWISWYNTPALPNTLELLGSLFRSILCCII
jgi:hypothetical protein